MRCLLTLQTAVGLMVFPVLSARGDGGEIDWDSARRFWAFAAPVLPPLPPVQSETWVRNEIDRFILHRLEAEGFYPAAEASQEVLVRRLSFDLTGLPPSQRGVDRYLLDGGRDPYGGLVRSLLNSPRFGERFASMWMNVARYGEDQSEGRVLSYPGAHHYRQWVIEAFNRDLPYDEFVRLQLAADLYGKDDLAALGFLALGPYPPWDATDDQTADMWADRVDTVTRGFLGLTVACARCHDHFYDPITAEDYNALAGIFDGTELGEIRVGTTKEPDPLAKFTTINGKRPTGGQRLFDQRAPGPRRNLRIFPGVGEPASYEDANSRREFAEAITSSENPLLARVIVNRIWGEIFGQYLVETPSNFGHSGELPSHPELLDYLAVRFVENGWSIKWLVREMVTSATYRQQSVAGTGEGAALLAGMKRRRLTAEMIRDAMLVVSDELTFRVEESARLDDPGNHRRTVYGVVSRVALDGFLREFDYPDPNAHAAKRGTSISPAQKLFLLNSPFVQARTAQLARDLHGREASHGLDALYFSLFARLPGPTEREIAMRFFNGKRVPGDERWDKFVQVLLSSNQFLYRE